MQCNLHERRPLTAVGMINGGEKKEKSLFKCPVKHVHETAVKCRGHLLSRKDLYRDAEEEAYLSLLVKS